MIVRVCARVPTLFISISITSANKQKAPGETLFTCADAQTVIAITLVCDFHPDCPDASDESFCRHPSCNPEHTCYSGQCIPVRHFCDKKQHCRDGTDEKERSCSIIFHHNVQSCDATLGEPVFPPAVVHLDGYGCYFKSALQATGEGGRCPETHVLCPGSYCVPVYVLCNGLFDCPGREDEVGCQEYTCPGFYRCRDSLVCLHPQHLCDGVFQCPRQDDEWYCDVTCPLGCRCRGLTAVCPRGVFSARDHPELRSVDASGSDVSLASFASSVYLMHLVLRRCRLSALDVPVLLNLRTLDVSHNRIRSFDTNVLLPLRNLIRLRLSDNPVSAIIGGYGGVRIETQLLLVELSSTNVITFKSEPFRAFQRLQVLNLSSSIVSAIASEGFQNMPALEVLDVRGTLLEIFPGDVFLGLWKLSRIYADNHKLCCEATLPPDFDPKNCLAPVDELSSCEDLLRSTAYRVCLWVFAVMATVGNIGSVVVKILFEKDSKSTGFQVFVLQLSVSDLIMGLYLVLIGSADIRYRGQYLWYDVAWKTSGLCQTAGFLSLLSAEVSAFIIFLITVDRFVVLKFPFSDVRFNRGSAHVACVAVWLLGGVLAGVPLLPATAHWRYYGQTGVCIPLPITRQDFAGRGYSFGVMIVFNLVVFLMIAAGQVVIYWSIHSNSMARSSSSSVSATATSSASSAAATAPTSTGGGGGGRKNQDTVIVRRLATVVVSDFLCWFPIGVLGVLSSVGVAIPGWLNVAVAILVLPINSAVNPFLYTHTLLMERRRKVLRAAKQKAVDIVVKNFQREEKTRLTTSCENAGEA